MFELPMNIQQVIANEKVKDNIGKIAIERGPIVYCAEFADNNGATSNLVVPDDQLFLEEFKGNCKIKSTVLSLNQKRETEEIRRIVYNQY
jgi:DUF1680 family protein